MQKRRLYFIILLDLKILLKINKNAENQQETFIVFLLRLFLLQVL